MMNPNDLFPPTGGDATTRTMHPHWEHHFWDERNLYPLYSVTQDKNNEKEKNMESIKKTR